jgi:DNA-binding NtrC family response regulator
MSFVHHGVPVSRDILCKADPHLVLLCHREDRRATLRAIADLRSIAIRLPIILLAEESCEDFAIDCFHSGVTRLLKMPCSPAQFSEAVKRVIQLGGSQHSCEPIDEQVSSTCRLVGDSRSMSDLRNYIHQVARCDSNVLITGETGTGKELVAQLIHEQSGRRHKPFVCLNSAAVPEPLVESELFGYERGAFTGAQTSHEGKLAAANGGTTFFDEIGDTTPGVQAKLLRAIESRQVYRLGSTRSRNIDIRVIAATNQDLEQAAREQRFRSDLYYRLNVVRIETPPLRERSEDIPSLVAHYIKRFNAEFGKSVDGLCPAALDHLLAYHWPGNVRELRNVVEAAFVNLPPGADGLIDLPCQVTRLLGRMMSPRATERINLLRTLTATKWNKTEAAKSLHWSRMTLYRKMNQYHISSASLRENEGGSSSENSG